MLKLPTDIRLDGIDEEIITNWIRKGYQQYLKSELSTKSSYEKGVTGEEYIKDLLKYDIGYNNDLAGDLTVKEYNIMLEIKNYESTIPYVECEKFYRDLGLNTYKGGIFISLKSRITKKGLFEFDLKNNCIFMVSSNKELIETAIEILNEHIESIKYVNKMSAHKVIKKMNKLKELCDMENVMRDIELLRKLIDTKLVKLNKDILSKDLRMRDLISNVKVNCDEINTGNIKSIITFIKKDYSDSHLVKNIQMLTKMFNESDVYTYKYNSKEIIISEISFKIFKSKTTIYKKINSENLKLLNDTCKYDKGILYVDLKDYNLLM